MGLVFCNLLRPNSQNSRDCSASAWLGAVCPFLFHFLFHFLQARSQTDDDNLNLIPQHDVLVHQRPLVGNFRFEVLACSFIFRIILALFQVGDDASRRFDLDFVLIPATLVPLDLPLDARNFPSRSVVCASAASPRLLQAKTVTNSIISFIRM